jgi:hypothetical protein
MQGVDGTATNVTGMQGVDGTATNETGMQGVDGTATNETGIQIQPEICGNGAEDNATGRTNETGGVAAPLGPEICDNGVDDDRDGLKNNDDQGDCPKSEEQIKHEQNELRQTIIDISPPTMNKEQVAEKFPITIGELPQGFRKVPEGSLSILPRIDYAGQWSRDDLNVYILVDPQTKVESQKFLVNAKNAVTGLSQELKNYSGNLIGFDVNVIEQVNVTSPVADIVILLVGDTTGNRGCSNALGFTSLHDGAANTAIPLYAEIFTSCLNQEFSNNSVYTTVKHEFLHTLGLGHAFLLNGDLMCSTESDINGDPVSTCDVPPEGDLVEPSAGDIKSLLYMYGRDGFGGNNQNIDAYPHYESATTSTNDESATLGNTTSFGTVREALGNDDIK